MATTVKRDPFARGEYKRFSRPGSTNKATSARYEQPMSCVWCGWYPRVLYSYVWWSDDAKEPVDESGKWFCNVECFTAYGG